MKNNYVKSIIVASAGTVLATAALVKLAYAATPPSIIAMEQSAKGGDVSITYANLPKDGFLVIHPSNSKGGMSEKSLGYVALKAGDHRRVIVKLNEPVKPGEKLWAALHQDTGSKGVYQAGKANVDPLFTDSGKPVEQSFKIK